MALELMVVGFFFLAFQRRFYTQGLQKRANERERQMLAELYMCDLSVIYDWTGWQCVGI